MKKNLFCVWCRGGVLVACALCLLLFSCGGGGGGGSDDYEAPVAESGDNVLTVSNGITGSQVFIDGRTVTIWARWCSDHEVTQEEYQSVMGSNPSYFSGTNKPVEQVSWYDAITYCNKRSLTENLTPCYTVSGVDFSDDVTVPTSNDDTWNAAECDFSANGYRLPTEAEWEYFARGGNITNSGQTDYSGSDIIGDVAWYTENSSSTTHDVKTKAKNNLNLYDMSGNVWEWCWDWYGSISASTLSTGASSGSSRVLRGGSWYDDAPICSVAYRGDCSPNYRLHPGFRVVRSAQ
ncbi:MAG: formylglycine-generating enzyme family protein [Treponema sp.]|nr:formylglycine-generating enzyme family protein [Treponema sp.]